MTVLWSAPTLAQGGAQGQHLRIEPLVGTKAADGSFDLALVTTPEPGWHGYWGENPGDAGFPPKIDWHAPAGTQIGAWRWPVPTTLLIAGLMNYVYEQPFAPMVRVRLPDDGRKPAVTLRLSYLVCTTTLCVPEAQDVSVPMAGVGTDAALDRWRAMLPRPLGASATYAVAAGRVRIAVPYPAGAVLTDAYFFPSTAGAIDYAAPQRVTRDGDRLLIETAGKPSGAIAGVLRVGAGRGLRLTAMPGEVPGGRAADWLGAALAAFGLAVLGGLILNVMPCVFPILSLKALSLARSGVSERHARQEALAYTAGVVCVLVALGGAMLALRAGGASVGWAFQLQEPRLVVVLLLLSAAIGFNLAGLFEVPTPPLGELAGSGGAFATGALAAVIATPCTGPFMGAALGVALVLPWPAALAIFAGLGLGLALPFLLIGFVPALRRLLPRPGGWMETARRVLAVPMFLTAIALGWVLGRQTGVDGLTFALLATLALAVVLWVAGARQRRGLATGLLLAAGLIVLGALAVTQLPGKVAARSAASELGSEAFSEARLTQLRQTGRPIFVYFTADWCLTCKVNERVAIEPAREAMRKRGVAVLVGDWTDGDPAMGRFIEAHNRAGVPLYLYYAPKRDARVLPQVLTAGMLSTL